MNGAGKKDICFAFEDNLREHQYDVAKNLDVMVMAYIEAIEALRDARAQIDEEVVLYKQDSGRAVVDIIDEVLSKYPKEFGHASDDEVEYRPELGVGLGAGDGSGTDYAFRY